MINIDYERPLVAVETSFSVGLPSDAENVAQTRGLLDAAWLAVERFERDELLRHMAVINSLIRRDDLIA